MVAAPVPSRPVAGVVVAASSALILSLFPGCGGRRRAGRLAASERRARGHARRCRIVARRGQRGRSPPALAVPVHGRAVASPASTRRRRVVDRDTVYVQDLRSNVFALDRATGAVRWTARYRAPNDGPNGLAARRRARLRGHRLGRVRARRRERPRALAAAPDAPERAVRRHRPGRLGRARLREHGRLPAHGGRGRSTRSTPRRARSAGGSSTIERPWRFPLEAGGGGLWFPVSVDAAGPPLRRELESRPMGRHAGAAERRRLPRPRPLHRLAARARRAHRPPALARPGDAARRARLRLPGDAGARDRRRATTSSSAPARPAA